MEEAVGAVEAEVEVVMAINRMVTMRPHLRTLPITVHPHLPTTTDVVEHPTITRKDTPRILLGRHHSNSTVVGTARAVPGHFSRLPLTAGTLTQMAAGPHRGRFQARIVGADITLGPQVEVDMVVAAMAVGEGDMAAVVAAGVMAMDMAEETSIILHHIRVEVEVDTVLVAMMVAIVLGVAERREAVAVAEVSEALASDFDV